MQQRILKNKRMIFQKNNTHGHVFECEQCGKTFVSKFNKKRHINQKHQSLLPEWLSTKKHMIYSESSVEKEHEIGHGQYGTVLKGKVVLGNSV